uniref:Uncharacterized protein n=1 Tax=Rhizophora mucronata TaxID=61149 RepID=A0A2P2LPA5_RHIMU
MNLPLIFFQGELVFYLFLEGKHGECFRKWHFRNFEFRDYPSFTFFSSLGFIYLFSLSSNFEVKFELLREFGIQEYGLLHNSSIFS